MGRPSAKCVTTIPDVGQIKDGADDAIPPVKIHTYKIYGHIHGKCGFKMDQKDWSGYKYISGIGIQDTKVRKN